MSLAELARSLHVKKGNRGALLGMLAKLKKRGLVEALSHERFLFRRSQRNPSPAPVATPTAVPEKIAQHKATARDEIRGRLVHHADGYGFVVPDVALPNVDGGTRSATRLKMPCTATTWW